MSLRLWIAAAVLLNLVACATTAPTTPAREVIASRAAPAAVGPYSQAIKQGNMLFLSGQLPLDVATGQFKGSTIEEHTAQVLENLKAVLAANGMTLADVVSTTVYLKDLNDFTKMNGVYATYFKDMPPARATIQVARLPRDASIEISAIASK